MVTKWQEKVTNETDFFASLGLNEATIAAAYGIMVPAVTVESYAHLVVSDGNGTPVPAGCLVDEPKASLVPLLGGFPNYGDSSHTHLPLSLFTTSKDVFDGAIDALTLEALTKPGPHVLYVMGGAIPEEADDGMNALSPTRRNAAYLKPVNDVDSLWLLVRVPR
jgi:hypothetical protein